MIITCLSSIFLKSIIRLILASKSNSFCLNFVSLSCIICCCFSRSNVIDCNLVTSPNISSRLACNNLILSSASEFPPLIYLICCFCKSLILSNNSSIVFSYSPNFASTTLENPSFCGTRTASLLISIDLSASIFFRSLSISLILCILCCSSISLCCSLSSSFSLSLRSSNLTCFLSPFSIFSRSC